MTSAARICIYLLFLFLLACDTGLAATTRAAEELLGEAPKPQIPRSSPAVSVPKPENITKNKVPGTVENGVQVKLQDCRYELNAQSVVCNIQLTSPSDVSRVVLFCYSGTQAVDSQKNILECNEIQLVQQQSWEYVYATLEKGASAKVQIKFKATDSVKRLSNLQMKIEVNGKRRSVQLTNVAVD